jgi:hypothetical protein
VDLHVDVVRRLGPADEREPDEVETEADNDPDAEDVVELLALFRCRRRWRRANAAPPDRGDS